MQNKRIGLITDKKLLNHKSKKKHPQRPQRLTFILNYLNNKLLTSHPYVDYVDHISRVATDQELKLAHKPKYIKHISNLWPATSHRSDIMVLDTYFNQHTEQCSKMAVGAVLQAIDNILQAKWKTGFALVRPPGHHSGGRNTINGFCIFNNVAVAAKYIQKKHKKTRVAIVDWDVHHGDGTQHIFLDNQDVLMISIHRYDRGTFYPASEDGHVSNMGIGWAEGTQVNISLDHVDEKFKEYSFQSPGDNQYIYIYHRIIEPILLDFQPEFILISSGFDAARNDPLGGFTVTPNGYFYLTRRMMELQIPMLVVLEGGYNLNSISEAAGGVMKALVGEQQFPQKSQVEEKKMRHLCNIHPVMHQQLDQIIETLSKHWNCLKSQELLDYTLAIKDNTTRVFGKVQDEESSSSSSEDDKADMYNEETKLPEQTPFAEPKPKKKQQKKQKQNVMKEVEEDDDQITPQFYFAAGHLQRFKNFSLSNEKVSKLTHDEEIMFYETMTLQRQFTPKYYGSQGKVIIIENLLFEQVDPVVIDVKLSRQSFNQALSEERREKQKKKQEKTTSESLNFRISGYTTPSYKQGGILVKNDETVKSILKNAVTKENQQLFCDYLTNLAATLHKINKKYFGTSIVLIKGPKRSEIRWVDFHYWQELEDGEYDENMIDGVNNLKKFIMELQLDN